MAMETQSPVVWPENAPIELGNPRKIEMFLEDEIRSRQITLIGELDLVSESSYAGINWSLFDLASYLVNKNIIKNSLTAELMANWSYPATLAIWSVGQAQLAEDGNKLWDIPGYSPGQLASLASMFTKSIEHLELATFGDELLGAQKHVQLARIHALIPDFAAQRYSEIIHRAVKYNQSKVQILNYVIDDTIISKGVRRLFSARQEIGLDLIERSFNYLAYGYELDLPDRLKSKLSRGNLQRKPKQNKDGFPSIIFLEYAGTIQVRGGESWQIIDGSGSPIEHQRIAESNLFAIKEGSDRVKILDVTLGYLLFDINGNLIYGSTLPLDGGYLLWRDDVKIVSEMQHLDDGHLPLWPNWNFTFFHSIKELLLELPDASTKRFESRKTVSVKDFRVPNLQDINLNGIYSNYPVIEETGYVKLTDHLTDIQIELENHNGPVIDGSGGVIDLTLSSGLGKSKSFKGLVIPNLLVAGIENALQIGSVAQISIELPSNWHFSYPDDFKDQNSANFQFKVEPKQEIMVLKVKDHAYQEHFIGLEVPILSWSVEFSNRESVTVATMLQLDVSSRKYVRAIILHGVNDYLPIISAGEVPISGRKRGNDARYDLRLLSDVLIDEESSIRMKWNYQEVTLVSFIKPRSKKMHSVDIRNLAAEAIAKKIISEEDWNSYQAQTQKQSVDLRNLLRRQRGN
jgi:hypothetical protein